MNPFLANSNFFENLNGSDAFVTLTIHNPGNAVLNIQSVVNGPVLLAVPPGNAVTAVFSVATGGVLRATLAGAAQFQDIAF